MGFQSDLVHKFLFFPDHILEHLAIFHKLLGDSQIISFAGKARILYLCICFLIFLAGALKTVNP